MVLEDFFILVVLEQGLAHFKEELNLWLSVIRLADSTQSGKNFGIKFLKRWTLKWNLLYKILIGKKANK